ncbi:hypothetical protein I8J29_10635 [Paenibacillus sp. MWE-103]|uniref:Uncharacterized protein n=1 Tax=Paenibacillus artemisiicola TaxID=1172618 RepID=A0ABS3W961_9BACL|nr:hypothetical protein [Paenibacillus artemisiicola]MBO7744655.1 hypothetical protein [Paenibacillus artemisiicola]
MTTSGTVAMTRLAMMTFGSVQFASYSAAAGLACFVFAASAASRVGTSCGRPIAKLRAGM